MSQYIQNNVSGAVCHVFNQSSASGAGPTDFGANYIFHVPQTTWAPPAMSATVTPSALALTETKYGIAYSPATAVSWLMTAGYYASVTWYQPTLAVNYADIPRIGKDDYVGAYCIQGS